MIMRKKLFSLFIVVLSATMSVVADTYDFEVGDLRYKITSNSVPCAVEVAQGYYSDLTTVSIPASVTYNDTKYSVTAIGDKAFYSAYNLTSVTIPNSVTIIGEHAFYDCANLTTIDIPNSVTRIQSHALGSTGLTSITIPKGITTLEEGVLLGTKLVSVVIPDNITSIGDRVFSGCEDLTSVTISNSVVSIGERAFRWCKSLTSVIIGNSVTSIGKEAFYSSGLTSIDIPNSVKRIGDNAFKSCTSLTSVSFGTGLVEIGTAFNGCSNITSVTWNARNCTTSPFAYYPDENIITSFVFGDEVESIPSSLCHNMIHVTSIVLPNSVKTIGDYAFSDCYALSSILQLP